MSIGISNSRTVPVSEDLTADDLSLDVLRGFETMSRVDIPLAPSVVLLKGEWAVLNSSGQAVRASTTPVANSYPVLAGTERFDVACTGKVTLIMGPTVMLKTNRYNTAVSYAPGDGLVAKNLGGGESFLTKRTGTEVVVGRVIEVGSNYLVFETIKA